MTKTKKAEDLLNRLVDAAEDILRDNGLKALTARTVTTRAGCALGSLYTVVEDMEVLLMRLNSRTLARLGDVLRTSAPDETATTEAKLQALATAYIDFAEANRNLWLVLFEHRLEDTRAVPDWHKQDQAVLIEKISGLLSEMLQDMPADAVVLRSRTIFAAVHGVVLMSLQEKFVGVPREHLRTEVASLVATLVRGSLGSE